MGNRTSTKKRDAKRKLQEFAKSEDFENAEKFLKEIFSNLDTDNDGYLNVEELIEGLKEETEDEKLRKSSLEIIKELDKDADSQISFEEFKGLIEKLQSTEKNAINTAVHKISAAEFDQLLGGQSPKKTTVEPGVPTVVTVVENAGETSIDQKEPEAVETKEIGTAGAKKTDTGAPETVEPGAATEEQAVDHKAEEEEKRELKEKDLVNEESKNAMAGMLADELTKAADNKAEKEEKNNLKELENKDLVNEESKNKQAVENKEEEEEKKELENEDLNEEPKNKQAVDAKAEEEETKELKELGNKNIVNEEPERKRTIDNRAENEEKELNELGNKDVANEDSNNEIEELLAEKRKPEVPQDFIGGDALPELENVDDVKEFSQSEKEELRPSEKEEFRPSEKEENKEEVESVQESARIIIEEINEEVKSARAKTEETKEEEKSPEENITQVATLDSKRAPEVERQKIEAQEKEIQALEDKMLSLIPPVE